MTTNHAASTGRLPSRASCKAGPSRAARPAARLTSGALRRGATVAAVLGIAQLVCTAANADVPGGKQPPAVDVRVHEHGTEGIWTVRCTAAGTVLPVPAAPTGGP
ncbi:hypothetical protein ACGFW5_23465 [Streptomyces sp. NPDC048416]|uniref:hypothetical protein n=1 Tax=Streptomyces sp. NPDC048416 TaxID=3365546 RepID=UPI003716F191